MADTSNDKILDAYIRHQTYLLRYAGGLRNDVLPILAATEADLYDAVVKWVNRIGDNRTITGREGRKWQTDFEEVVKGIRDPAWLEMYQHMDNEFKELAVYEAANAARTIEAATPVILGQVLPPPSKLVAIVNSQPFEGETLKGWMKRTATADVNRLLDATKIGIVNGETPTQVARRVVGTKVFNRRDGAARKAFTDTESVILTLTNGVQQEAKQALYQANSDIFDKEIYVATLDARTTVICASNDNKTFDIGKGPIPPLHFRCRSTRAPYLNPESLGDRPFNPTTERQLLREYTQGAKLGKVTTRDQLPRGHKGRFDDYARRRKRELIGQVPAQTSFNNWLKNQTTEFQNEYLGPTRAKLFRQGGITLDKFVARDGTLLTLDQLKQKGIDLPTE